MTDDDPAAIHVDRSGWGGNGGDVKQELDTYSYNHIHLSVH